MWWFTTAIPRLRECEIPATAAESEPPVDPPAWFLEIHHDLSRDLIGKVMGAGGSLEEAEDATAETLLELLQHALGGKRIDNPPAWARRAVWSNFLKVREGDRKRLKRLREVGYVLDEGEDDRLVIWEDKQWVDQLLDQLSPTQREVMESILEGLSTEEVSQLLGKTPANVRKNLQLARARLKPLIGTDREEDAL